MYSKNDKRRLYWLIEQYINNKITIKKFEDEFYLSYDLEINYSDLSPLEEKEFSELANIISRYSEFDSDHKLDIKAFTTEEEVREIAERVYKNLK